MLLVYLNGGYEKKEGVTNCVVFAPSGEKLYGLVNSAKGLPITR